MRPRPGSNWSFLARVALRRRSLTLPSTVRHRVVIVGSGFGGLFAAKSLARAPKTIEVTLISRINHHLFQPLLYQVATGILSEGEIAPATRDVLRKRNMSHRAG